MRKPSLTFDSFVAALAVVGASASAGCSKASPTVQPEPAPQAAPASPVPAAPRAEDTAATTAAQAAASPAPNAAPSAAGSVKAGANGPVTATPVDGGKPAVGNGTDKGSHASCAAGGCTADMKKGSGN